MLPMAIYNYMVKLTITDGVSDSTQALEYTEPKKDNIE